MPVLAPVRRQHADENLDNTGFVIGELHPLFKGKLNRNELVLSLKHELRRYHGLDQPGFRDAINQYIIKESIRTCSIHLNEGDIREVWKE